jgi:ABC-2 type transport system ATP-binding protein
MSIVELRDVRAGFGATEVLHGVSLTVERSEIYGLLGPNGAGKTTSLAVIAGLLRATGGVVRVLERDPAIDSRAVHAGSGVLPEQNGFYDWMPAEDYLRFFARLHGRRLERTGIAERLRRAGLAPRPGQRIGTFSRGMKQRLGLARALINEPQLLLLDEPTNGLDPRGRREFHDLLLDLARNGVAILICTHLLDDVDRLCRRIGILDRGRMVLEGAVAELAGGGTRYRLRLSAEPPEAPPVGFTVAGREGPWWIVELHRDIQPSVAWGVLIGAGWPIMEIRPASSSLEEAYLRATEGTPA